MACWCDSSYTVRWELHRWLLAGLQTGIAEQKTLASMVLLVVHCFIDEFVAKNVGCYWNKCTKRQLK